MPDEARLAPCGGQVEGHIQAIGRQHVGDSVGPFDHADSPRERILDAELPDLFGRLEPVKVEMIDHGRRRGIGLHQSESRARHLVLDAQGPQKSSREDRFAGAQVAPQRDHVAGFDTARDPAAEGGRRGFVGEGDGGK